MSQLQPDVTPSVTNNNYDSFLGLLQSDDVVLASSDDLTFASNEDFRLLHDAKALAWKTLPLDVIYQIRHVKKIRTLSGQDSIILHLYAKHATIPHIVWASNLLAKELLGLKEIKNLYVKSLGLKKSVHSGRDYYNYQLVQKQ
jgi:hypothetical protein